MNIRQNSLWADITAIHLHSLERLEEWGVGRGEEGERKMRNGTHFVAAALLNDTATVEKLGSFSEVNALLTSAESRSVLDKGADGQAAEEEHPTGVRTWVA